MMKEENHKLSFLDVLIDNSKPDFPQKSVFRKKTYNNNNINFIFTKLKKAFVACS